MPARIENMIYICNEDSIMEFSGDNNIMKNVKFYNLTKYDWKIRYNYNPIRMIFLYLGHIFRRLADLCYGINSGYKICCIGAYIINKALVIPELQQGLCHKCYKKLLKSE